MACRLRTHLLELLAHRALGSADLYEFCGMLVGLWLSVSWWCRPVWLGIRLPPSGWLEVGSVGLAGATAVD
jgi:hypothetical protein